MYIHTYIHIYNLKKVTEISYRNYNQKSGFIDKKVTDILVCV